MNLQHLGRVGWFRTCILLFRLSFPPFRFRLSDVLSNFRLCGFPGERRPWSGVAIPGPESLQSPPCSSMHLVLPPALLRLELDRAFIGHPFMGLVKQKRKAPFKSGACKKLGALFVDLQRPSAPFPGWSHLLRERLAVQS